MLKTPSCELVYLGSHFHSAPVNTRSGSDRIGPTTFQRSAPRSCDTRCQSTPEPALELDSLRPHIRQTGSRPETVPSAAETATAAG